MELVHYSRLQTYLSFWKIVYEAGFSQKIQVSDRHMLHVLCNFMALLNLCQGSNTWH